MIKNRNRLNTPQSKMVPFKTLNPTATTTTATTTQISYLQRFKSMFIKVSFPQHLIISILLRLALIWYGQKHDEHSEVPYTDIDYKVVTDGGRYVLHGSTPFARHTYRYSPVLAYIQIPNILVHPAMGKLIYSGFDIFVAILIYTLVHAELKSQCRKAVESLLQKLGKSPAQNNRPDTDARNRPELIARASACFWLYNPLTAVISTRGNGDSFSSFFVILSLFLLVKSDDAVKWKQKNLLVFAAGLMHGFAIHLRLYPLLFSLAYYLCLSDRLTRNLWDFLRQIFIPNSRQILLVLGTLLGICSMTGYFYYLYGWQYIHEAYLYHFVRKDVRHNFSLYFLLQYLSGGATSSSLTNAVWYKFLIQAPQLFLLLYLSFSFGHFRQTLPFCVFSLAFVMVTFNTVVTSQYFVWYLALLPLCLNNLQSIPLPEAFVLGAMWLLAQAFWLVPAYLLEFKTWHTFYWIGAQGVIFFLANNVLLACLIQHYSFTSFKVNFKKLL